jgi:hypothetical protein
MVAQPDVHLEGTRALNGHTVYVVRFGPPAHCDPAPRAPERTPRM